MQTKVNNTQTIHSGRVFDFTVENVSLSNGVTVDLEVIRHPGASAIVPLNDDQEVILIKQYRHAVGNHIWEIPAGTFDGKEAPLVCAQRELVEETGFSASQWDHLGGIIPVPGYSDEHIHLFLARNLSPADQQLDQDEILEVHTIPFQQVVAMITEGKITDAKTIAGVFLALNRLNPG